jgi:hypothetical protein
LHDLKVSSGYSSNFKRLVSVKDMKMNFNLTKPHDCHVVMTDLVPIALRGIKIELVRDAVTSLCFFFNAIEKKVIDEEKLLDLERRHFETLFLLEATFPPSLFDLMLHLTAHLAREIWFIGPSYLHYMFPYERFYGFVKSLVHNRLFPEGAIFCGYETISKQWSGPWVIWTHKTPLVCLVHGMKVGFQVLGPWGKVSYSRTRCLPKGSFCRDTTAAPNYTVCQ